MPIVEAIRTDWKNVLRAIGLKLGDGFLNVFAMSFVLTFATVYLNYSREIALNALTIGCATMLVTIPFGRLYFRFCGLNEFTSVV